VPSLWEADGVHGRVNCSLRTSSDAGRDKCLIITAGGLQPARMPQQSQFGCVKLAFACSRVAGAGGLLDAGDAEVEDGFTRVSASMAR
jgi:hypothetical protein